MLLAINTDAGCTASTVGAFVLDFSEAFWQIPIHPLERRFFCASTKIDGQRKYIAFNRVAQGSANGPNLWGRVAALIMRLSQALFHPTVLNLLCYVDDPVAAMRGTDEDRMVYAAMLILVWEAVGFGLSYHKGQLNDLATWILGNAHYRSRRRQS